MNTELTRFLQTHRVTASAERVSENPNIMTDFDGQHWKVTLRANGRTRQLTTYFSQGWAHTQAPTAGDVLDCLAMDAASVENARSFEDWASELGYDADSRKAEKL
jgi:hypothetical protein